MDNLIFCLNVTVPIFLTLLLGYFFRRIGLFDEAFVNRMNKFVFVIPLPVLLFQDIAKIDIYEAWDSKMDDLLFSDHLSQYHNFRTPVPPPPSIRYPGRVYPGILPQQCRNPWHRCYPESLRKRRHGTADDHCKCTSL